MKTIMEMSKLRDFYFENKLIYKNSLLADALYFSCFTREAKEPSTHSFIRKGVIGFLFRNHIHSDTINTIEISSI